jgi:competence protein ComEA
MILKYGLIAGALVLAGFLIWHPARAPIVESAAATVTPAALSTDLSGSHRYRRAGRSKLDDALVVYVAGAVKRPGLYRLNPGERDAQAIALAGGLSAGADAGAVNLAQRAGDGDEIYVPAQGETTRARLHSAIGRSAARRGRRHALPPSGSVDVNHSDATELAAVPGIGRAIAERIVELRTREGAFASLDELLDVAGMTQSRLERARSYLRDP